MDNTCETHGDTITVPIPAYTGFFSETLSQTDIADDPAPERETVSNHSDDSRRSISDTSSLSLNYNNIAKDRRGPGEGRGGGPRSEPGFLLCWI